jgi:TonB-dependent receptor
MAGKLLLGSASALAALFACCAPAFAQEAADDEEIVVTGVRASLRSAQEVKRNSDYVIDSVVAEDVGKLPDNNVADALARVTGIQIRRDSGEGNSVLIRGLPNVVSLLNGREVFTTTGRFIALADIPANMLQRVDVYKSVPADQIEGGIAGAIDVRTRRPFDNEGYNLNVNARAFYNDKAESWNPNLGATISNTWSTGAGEFGALLGLSYIRSDFHEERAFNVESVTQTGCPPGPGGAPVPPSATCGFFNSDHPAPVDDFRGPFVMGYIPIAGERERPGANVALQWRPNANTELYFEGFASKYINDFELDFFVGLPFLGNGDISGTVYPNTNIMKTLTNHDVFTITSTQANHQEGLTQQYAFGGSHTAGDFALSADLSFTDSEFEFENPILDVAVIVPLVNVDTNHDGTAQLDYGGPNFDIRSEDGFFLANWFDNYGNSSGESVDFRFDVDWTNPQEGVIREISGGLRGAQRRAESISSFIGGTGGPPIFTLASEFDGLGCLSEPMADGGPDYIMTQWYTPCADFLLDNTGQIRDAFTGTSDPRPLDPGSLFSDIESTAAFYFQTKLGGEFGPMPWSAIAGVRYAITKEDLAGNFSQDTDPNNPGLEYTPINRRTTSYDLLPTLSVKLNITDELLARFSAGRTITRPNFPDLNPGVSLSTVVSNTTGLTGAGGNPDLRPVVSDNFDLALEWYFAADSSLAVTAFRREVEGYVIVVPRDEVFFGDTYRVTRPRNAQSTTVEGFEVTYQQFYDFLPGFLSGLGLLANVTVMEGETFNSDTNVTDTIAGLSELSYNIIGLYEHGRWSGRLAYNWRDSFLDTRAFTPTYDLYVDETAQLDGQLSFAATENMTFTIEGINLLDTHFKDYFDDPNNPQLAGLFPRDTRRYDRTVLVGVRWRN